MNASEFTSRWGTVVEKQRVKAEAAGVPEVADDLNLITAPSAILYTPSFPSAAAQFLVEAGLPGSCAPFLTFDAVARGPLGLVQYYGVHQFEPSDLPRLAPYYVLGADGAGNPLCLDSAEDGEIVMLDHEDRFRTRTFVAASVATLAESLLAAETLPRKNFIEHLRGFDPRAAERTAFMPGELGLTGPRNVSNHA